MLAWNQKSCLIVDDFPDVEKASCVGVLIESSSAPDARRLSMRDSLPLPS
jgi:hypothetical protein